MIKEKTVKESGLNRRKLLDKMIKENTYDNWKDNWNKKRQNSLNRVTNNGKTVRENCLELRSTNIKKEFIDKEGKITTIAKEDAKKSMATKRAEFIDKDGNITNSIIEGGKKCSKKLKEKVFCDILKKYITRAEKRVSNRSIKHSIKTSKIAPFSN